MKVGKKPGTILKKFNVNKIAARSDIDVSSLGAVIQRGSSW
jgi:hypothetical protein